MAKRKSEDKIIADTSMMFMACACYVLHERNGFGKSRLMQFMADIQQVNNDNEYEEIIAVLNEKMGMEFPSVEKKV